MGSLGTFGRYELLSELGEGAMGRAFLARPLDGDVTGADRVVVKTLHRDLNDGAEFSKRFLHEAEIARLIQSPHLPRVFETGQYGGLLFFAMEYVEGPTLKQVFERSLERGQPFPVDAVAEIVGGALRGLDALHSAKSASGEALGIVHRDVSPKNLILGLDGRVRIIDLGLGRSVKKDWQTRMGMVLGTPGYLAPEQVFSESVDRRADLYAAGVIAYELLCLRYLIPRGSIPAMLKAATRPEIVAPSALRPELPKAVDAVLRSALDPRPEGRYASARAFLAALEGVLGRVGQGAIGRLLMGLGFVDAPAERVTDPPIAPHDTADLEVEPTLVRKRGAITGLPALPVAGDPADFQDPDPTLASARPSDVDGLGRTQPVALAAVPPNAATPVATPSELDRTSPDNALADVVARMRRDRAASSAKAPAEVVRGEPEAIAPDPSSQLWDGNLATVIPVASEPAPAEVAVVPASEGVIEPPAPDRRVRWLALAIPVAFALGFLLGKLS